MSEGVHDDCAGGDAEGGTGVAAAYVGARHRFVAPGEGVAFFNPRWDAPDGDDADYYSFLGDGDEAHAKKKRKKERGFAGTAFSSSFGAKAEGGAKEDAIDLS